MGSLIHTTTLVAALGCGLVSGILFTFSTFVMPALDDLAPEAAIRAMQSINRAAITPLFMLALLGTALVCLVLIVWAIRSWHQPGARLVLAGAALYLAGVIAVTFAGNVPLNDALDTVRPEAADAAREWADFLSSWSALNHARTVAGIAAAGLLTVALRSVD